MTVPYLQVFSTLALSSLWVVSGPVFAAPDGPVAFSPCVIGSAQLSAAAECASLAVPLDPEEPDGKTIDLAIARVPAYGTVRSDPMTLISGGPGQSARESWPAVAQAFEKIARDRDVILIDQRGTGESRRLDCPSDVDVFQFAPDAPLERLARDTRNCLESLPADPRLFTTSIAVQDLDAVRRQLGIEHWNIYGVSYGTRVAAHYARRFPERVRTLLLDAIVPPGQILGPDIGRFAQRALDGLFARCRRERACAETFPRIESRTRDFIESLGETPRTVSYEELSSGQLRTMDLTREHLAGTLRLMTYSHLTAALLPSMLHEAIENDNLAPLARQAQLQSKDLSDALATGMHHAVVCTEDEPWFESTSDDADHYLGDLLPRTISTVCAEWPRGRIDDDFHAPLTVDVPTLLLSGELDPITPPAYGRQLAKSLPDARHVVLQEQGHMQATLGCMSTVMAAFVSSGSNDSLPLECLERIHPWPFFIDANGPAP